MAPSKDLSAQENGHTDDRSKKNGFMTLPCELGGHLKDHRSFKSTPVIGTEFPDANLAEWLTARNSYDLVRDLALTSEYEATIGTPTND